MSWKINVSEWFKDNVQNCETSISPIELNFKNTSIGLNIQKISNVHINYVNNNTDINVVSDPVYISTFTKNYFHMMFDEIGIYLYIKQFVPDLKLYMFREFDDYEFKMPTNNRVSDAFSYIGIDTNKYLFNLNECNILFNNVYDITSKAYLRNNSDQYKEILKILKNHFANFIKDESRYDNIYITRKTVKDFINPNREILNVDVIEQYFKDIGYTVLDLNDISFFDQMQIFGNAKKIIGPSGAGFTNLIFAKEGTVVVEVNPDTESHLTEIFKQMAESYNLRFHRINLPKIIDGSKIVKILKDQFLHILNPML
jgi:hypothetical protein